MKTYKFACPQCQQHIECDDRYAGMRIPCPACQGEIVIPAGPSPSVPPPAPPPPSASAPAPPASGARLSISLTSHGRPATPAQAAPDAASRPARPAASSSGGGRRTKRVLATAAVVATLVVGLILAIPAVTRYWAQMQEQNKNGSSPTGGQVGHLGELNAVMDATEDLASGGAAEKNMGQAGSAQIGQLQSLENLPLVPAAWTLDLQTAKIPNSKANGSIAGWEFVLESAYVVTGGGSAPVLSLRQGGTAGLSKEVLIYLGRPTGSSLEGKSWTVTAQDPAGGAKIVKRWQAEGGLRQETFSSGFALKLELGQAIEGVLPGKIFLSLPDAEQGVVAGLFQATLRVASPPQTTSASPGRGGPGMGQGQGANGGAGPEAGNRRGPAESVLKQRARGFGADRERGSDPDQ